MVFLPFIEKASNHGGHRDHGGNRPSSNRQIALTQSKENPEEILAEGI
jgi:hypothetical protein